MLEVLGIKNAQKLVPLKDGDDMKPRDPVSENMDVINGKPVKAFIYQDHEAHIAVHTADARPKIMQLMGQNPTHSL
jgi:predicted RNA-binding protein (virulence factor B family)